MQASKTLALLLFVYVLLYAWAAAGAAEISNDMIGDYVWFDEDNDGIQDDGEIGLNGIRVVLDGPGGRRTMTTVSGGPRYQPGYYGFGNLVAGQYTISVDTATVPTGYYAPTEIHAPGSTSGNDSDDPAGTTVMLLTDESQDLTIDFGYARDIVTCCGRIGDYVWFDADRDGIQDDDEVGLNGVSVILEGPGGMQTATTFTGGPLNQPGFYGFSHLCVGDYVVRVDPFTVPADYQPTEINADGSTVETDSDDPTGTNVTLPFGQSSNKTIDFGYVGACTGQVGDYVWLDANHNGIQDLEEQGINGVEVWLADEIGVRSMVTFTGGPLNQPGYYLFEGLCAGAYFVSVNPGTVPPGYGPTALSVPGSTPENDSDDPSGTLVMLSDDSSNTTIDFGYVAPCAGRIGDYVWLDVNGNGIQDADEPGINGINVQLVDMAGAVATVTTFTGGPANQAGFYIFDGLCAGTYGVLVDAETVPPGYNPTVPYAFGSTTENDSDDHDGTPVTLYTDDWSDVTIDFGYVQECSDCEGGVIQLTLQYLGASEARVTIYEGKKLEEDKRLFAGTLSPGGDFTFTGVRADLKMGAEISLYVNDVLHTKIHTSCSQPIGPGLVSGDFKVIDGYSKDGGRLCPLPPQAGCGDCAGGVTRLTLRYMGTSDALVTICEGKGRKHDKQLFEGWVSPGGDFTFSGVHHDLKMGAEISLYVNDVLHTKIHTSCSQPIGPGLVSGDFHVIDGYSKDGGQLCPLPPQPDCGECRGGVTRLTLRYMGASDALVTICEGKGRKADKQLFEGWVSPGGDFTFAGVRADLKMGAEISLYVNDVLHTKIHTSCSQPIGPGLVSGDFQVIDGYSKDGGQLCPLPPQPDCGECKGGVTRLTLQYMGASDALVTVFEGKGRKADKQLFEGWVSPGGDFTFTGVRADLKMGAEISLYVDDVLHAKIHTSCSQPIGPGLVSGDFQVIDGYSKDGGRLCPLP